MNNEFNLKYEQYLLGELNDSEAKALENEPGFAGKIDLLKKENESFYERFPSLALPEAEDEVVDNVVPFRRGLIPLAAAAAVVLFAVLTPLAGGHFMGDDPVSDLEITRMKGVVTDVPVNDPYLTIYRNAGEKPELLSNNSLVAEHDLLQVGYFARESMYGAIVSLDGNGYATLHYPDSGTESTLLEPGKEVLLPFAYELDNAPVHETFFFLYSEEAFNILSVIDSLEGRNDKNVDIPKLIGRKGTVNQYRLSLKKEN